MLTHKVFLQQFYSGEIRHFYIISFICECAPSLLLLQKRQIRIKFDLFLPTQGKFSFIWKSSFIFVLQTLIGDILLSINTYKDSILNSTEVCFDCRMIYMYIYILIMFSLYMNLLLIFHDLEVFCDCFVIV